MGRVATLVLNRSILIEDAVEQTFLMDQETTLGQALTDFMVLVNQEGLLDQFLGYDRDDPVVRVWFSRFAKKEQLDKLVTALQKSTAKQAGSTQFLDAELLQDCPDEDDFCWIVKFSLRVEQEQDDQEEVPVEVELDGDVETGEEEQGDQDGDFEVPEVRD
jgi:hypothetical protein